LVVDRACKFGFNGAVLLKGKEADEGDEDDTQGQLPV
jgi:hypothetical protein